MKTENCGRQPLAAHLAGTSTSHWLGSSSARSATKAMLQSISANLGVRYFLFAAFPTPERSGLPQTSIATNWPAELQLTYAASRELERSELVRLMKRSILPVRGGNSLFLPGAETAEGNAIRARFDSFGFGESLAFSLHSASGSKFIFVFSSDTANERLVATNESIFGGIQVLDFYSSSISAAGEPRYSELTEREMECLRWSAEGKTTEEIATILSLSHYTVAEYVKGAMRKLKAVTRMQAIATAIRQGLI